MKAMNLFCLFVSTYKLFLINLIVNKEAALFLIALY